MIKVNALGDACPIPVVKTKNALRELSGAGVVETTVDNLTAVENLMRLAGSMGASAVVQTLAPDRYTVTITLGDTPAADAPADCLPCAPAGDTVVVIASDAMGSGADELGTQLMKGFLYALSQQDTLPAAILFYNGGAKLTCLESPALEDLQAMAAKGVEVLTCGTCLSYYGLADQLAVGTVTNMYTIVEKMTGAARLVKP